MLTNRSEEALSASRMLVARSRGDPVGWFLLWGSAKVASDTSLVRSTEAKLQHWQEGGPELKNVIAFLDHYPILYRALALSPK